MDMSDLLPQKIYQERFQEILRDLFNSHKRKEESSVQKSLANGPSSQKPAHVAEIVRHGQKLVLPDGLSYDAAISLLEHEQMRSEEVIEVVASINCFPWDGANALSLAAEELFGLTRTVEEVRNYGFCQETCRPGTANVEIGPGVFMQIPFGRLVLAGVEGHIDQRLVHQDGRWILGVTATIKRGSEEKVVALFRRVREILKERSIYKGKAVKLRFRNEGGELLQSPAIKFIELDGTSEAALILPQDVWDDLSINLWSVLERSESVRAAGVPIKRGILLAGPYGVGKSLAARVTALKATSSGFTFIYCQAAAELPDAWRFAEQYQPAVVFCEDIDRVADGDTDEDRTEDTDKLLNVLDGMDTKSNEIVTVLTTNDPEAIHPAMLRPGRLDAIVWMTPPDVDTVKRLLQFYGGEHFDSEVDLERPAVLLEGHIPAVVREAVERAKLAAIRAGHDRITTEALLRAARSLKRQASMIAPRSAEQGSEKERAFDTIIAALAQEISK
jgi:transitional endoplasmic reticulum ATPase